MRWERSRADLHFPSVQNVRNTKAIPRRGLGSLRGLQHQTTLLQTFSTSKWQTHLILATEFFVTVCPHLYRHYTSSQCGHHQNISPWQTAQKTPLPNVKQHYLPLGNTIHLSHFLHSSDFTPAAFTPVPFLFPFPRFPGVFVILSYCAICFLVGCLKCFLRQGDRQAVTRTDTVDLAAEEIWLQKKKVRSTSQNAKLCYKGLFKRM